MQTQTQVQMRAPVSKQGRGGGVPHANLHLEVRGLHAGYHPLRLERRARNGLVVELPLERRHREKHSTRVRLGQRERNCTADSHRLHTGSRT